MTYETELAVAVSAVETASRLCIDVRSRTTTLEAVVKSDRSPVTVADFGSQAVMTLALAKAFANDLILAEEEAATLHLQTGLLENVRDVVAPFTGRLTHEQLLAAVGRGSAAPPAAGRFWTMDPIDGTKGFLRNDQFAVALALIEDGKVVLGVLGCPVYAIGADVAGGMLFYAVKDDEAYERPLAGGKSVPLTACGAGVITRMRFCESLEPAHADHATHRRIAEILGIDRPPLRMDSQAKYGAIARGDADIYLRLPRDRDYREKIWDHAAGSFLVEQAGGTVTDFEGKSLDFSAGRHLANLPGIIACNREVHEPVLQAVRKAAAQPWTE